MVKIVLILLFNGKDKFWFIKYNWFEMRDIKVSVNI